jgi:hypothetical protein
MRLDFVRPRLPLSSQLECSFLWLTFWRKWRRTYEVSARTSADRNVKHGAVYLRFVILTYSVRFLLSGYSPHLCFVGPLLQNAGLRPVPA